MVYWEQNEQNACRSSAITNSVLLTEPDTKVVPQTQSVITKNKSDIPGLMSFISGFDTLL